MIVDDWRAGKLSDQPRISQTLGLAYLSPEGVEIFNEQLREILDKLFWRVLRLENEIALMKERGQ